MVGMIAGRYQVEDVIGSGGMGTVYRGIDTLTGQPIAVKLLKPELIASSPDIVERFTREGEALRQLNHPNIVKMLATAQQDGQHYLIMEYIAGGSLYDLVQQEIPLDRVLTIALELADALARAHHLKIIHRDIKPANVLIAEDGTPRLTDFGVAHMGGEEHITQTGMALGTLGYLSPEILNGEPADARSDIWAFGVLLFEMVAGRHPFESATVTGLITAILTKAVPDLEALRENVPVALLDLIYRMLEKDRRQRIPSARLIGAELEVMADGHEIVLRRGSARRDALPLDDTPTTLGTALRHNLVPQTTPFVGREMEINSVMQRLSDPGVRLLTILGPGGMGKTRLALETAQRIVSPFAAQDSLAAVKDGVYFVPLAPLSSADFMVSTIADAVGFQFYQSGESRQQVLDYLREKSLLLIMDNFEHLLAGAALIAEILAYAPNVKVLATSRERLNLSAEELFALAGMDFPEWESPGDGLDYSAVKLFLQGARRVSPNFELAADDLDDVARICRLAQGMPLAILLAASWIEMLSPREIAGEIVKSIDFLETELRDVPERHRSIRAVFDYSWRLLSADERALFARLSVFRGGFTREAAQAVASADLRTLIGLVSKSLLRRNPDNGRYEVHELLRQYSETRLRELTDDMERVCDSHSEYYCEFLSRQESKLKSLAIKVALADIEAEMDNVRAAWHWALHRGTFAGIGKAITSLGLFYERRALYVEARTVMGAVVEAWGEPNGAISADHARAVGIALTSQAMHFTRQGRDDQANLLLDRALALLDETAHPRERAAALTLAAFATLHLGNFTTGFALGESGLKLYRTTDDRWGIANTLNILGSAHIRAGQFDRASQLFNESIAIQKTLDEQAIVLPESLIQMGYMMTTLGEYAEGRRILLDGLSLVQAMGDVWGELDVQGMLANLERSLGDYAAAEAYTAKTIELSRNAGSRWYEGWCHIQLGDNLKEQGRYDEAAAEYRAGYLLAQQTGDIWLLALARFDAADMAVIEGRYADAKPDLEASLAGFETIGTMWGVVLALDNLAFVAVQEHDNGSAGVLFRRALNIAMRDKMLPFALNVAAGIALLLAKTGQPVRAVELLALTQNHPAAERQTRMRRVEPLLAALRADVPAEAFNAALVRGAALDLESAAQELLAETS